MKVERTRVYNMRDAIRGMRNPKESWHLSDTQSKFVIKKDRMPSDFQILYIDPESEITEGIHIGPNDMKLAQQLIRAGNEHRKFLRQIFTSCNITAPLYWWKEADTYKIGTTSNSTSTMHKITAKPITLDCFETGDFNVEKITDVYTNKVFVEELISKLEYLRLSYLKTKDMAEWKELIRWLPESWLQTRTWTANYEVLRSIYFQRKNHKLSEWRTFCKWIEKLPYANDLIIIN